MRLTFVALLVTTFVVMFVGFTSAGSVHFVKNVDDEFRRLRVSAHIQEERGVGDGMAKIISSLKDGGVEMAKMLKIFTNPEMAAFKVTDDEVAKMLVLVKSANAGKGIGLTDDEVAKFARSFATAQKSAKLTDDQVVKLSKMVADAKRLKEVTKVSDDEVAKVSAMFKNANAGATGRAKFTDDEVAKLGKAFAAGQKGAGLSDEQVSKLAKLFADAKKVTSARDEVVAKLSQVLAVVAQKDKKSWSTLKKVIVGTLGVVVGGAVIYGTVKLVNNDSASATPATSIPLTST